MMTPQEQEIALDKMREASSAFYSAATSIGNHPFIEFTGLMNEYIAVCESAMKAGIDFSECNTHSGKSLPMHGHHINYINEKLECIFTGRSVMDGLEPLKKLVRGAVKIQTMSNEELAKELEIDQISSRDKSLILKAVELLAKQADIV